MTDAELVGAFLGVPSLSGMCSGASEVPDDDDEVAESLGLESRRELVDRLLRRGDEGRSVGQVLDRVSGQHHLRQHHEVSAARGGFAARREDELGVAVQVAHTGVHLGEGEAQLGHVSSLSTLHPTLADDRVCHTN